jgi:hypothetical protein
MNTTRVTHPSKTTSHRKLSAIVACSLALAALSIPSTAAAAGCTSTVSAPSVSGGLIRASGSATCSSLAVAIDVCIQWAEGGTWSNLSCATGAARAGETARATATFPCVLPSARYRSSIQTDALNAQGDPVSSGLITSGPVTLTCPVG